MRSSSTASTIVLALALITVFAAWPASRAGEHPEAAELLDRFVDAIGGAEAFAGLENRVSKATLEIENAGISIDVETYHARPARYFKVMSSAVTGRIESGCNGSVAWQNAVTTGPQVFEGDARDDLLRDATFDHWPEWRSHVREARLLGQAEHAGRPAHMVEFVPAVGGKQTLYFDVENGLLVRIDSVAASPAGPIPVETYLGDYRGIDGVKLAFEVRQKIGPQTFVARITSMRHNVELDAELFALPAEIEALVAAPTGAGN